MPVGPSTAVSPVSPLLNRSVQPQTLAERARERLQATDNPFRALSAEHADHCAGVELSMSDGRLRASVLVKGKPDPRSEALRRAAAEVTGQPFGVARDGTYLTALATHALATIKDILPIDSITPAAHGELDVWLDRSAARPPDADPRLARVIRALQDGAQPAIRVNFFR